MTAVEKTAGRPPRRGRLPLWAGLGVSLLLHLGVLAAMPGTDTEARCPVMLITLKNVRAADKPTEKVAEPEPATIQPAADPVPLQQPAPQQNRLEVSKSPQDPATTHQPASPAAAALGSDIPVEIVPSTSAKEKPATAGNSAVVAESGSGRFVIAPPSGGGGELDAAGDGPDNSPETALNPGGSSIGGEEGPAIPASPSPPAIDTGPIKAAYQSRLYALIAAAQGRHRPDEDVSGTVRVSFVINADGSLGKVSVSSSSGYGSLDDAALAALRDAAQSFPAFPHELAIETMKVGMNLKYRQVD